MKLISGIYGGRNIKTVADRGLRPAMAKTRESIFSILESRCIDWSTTSVLDLFAGCGSLGLEAISRGAQLSHFVENGVKPFQCLTTNITSLNLSANAKSYKIDALKFLRQDVHLAYNLVFLDPPYRNNYIQVCVNALQRGHWLAKDAILVAEVENETRVDIPNGLQVDKIRKFGQTNIYFWVKQ